MTNTAVGMNIQRRLPGTVVTVDRCFVLVGVVAEMLGSDVLLVLAVCAGRRPDGLERQQEHQKNEGKAFHHGPECNRSRVVTQCGVRVQHPVDRIRATLRFMM